VTGTVDAAGTALLRGAVDREVDGDGVTAARATPQDDHGEPVPADGDWDGRLACVAIVVPVDMVSLSKRSTASR
jgi:hypothetical protein